MTVHAQLPGARPAAEGVPVGALDVAGDEQVEPTVAIEVRKGAARAPARRSDTGGRRDVGERAVPRVAIQDVWAVVGEVEVGQSVVVVVARAGAHAVRRMPDAG